MSFNLPSALEESGRFAVRRCLGSGGFGVVYAAYDKERDAEVALKWLRHGDPSVLTRFKREFRSLADLDHPNLVHFRDLFAMGDDWFFTMDLVDGGDLLGYVRPSAERAPAAPSRGASESLALAPNPSTIDLPPLGRPGAPPVAVAIRSRGPSSRRPLCIADLGRLRTALEQLAAGLMAIHAVGMLHRDVKPSNVMVTRDGRVVLLDFGLVTEIGRDGIANTAEERVVGTPAYMSPEQGLGTPVTAASDWYAVGVILYEALTGELPIPGTGQDVLMRKNLVDPTPPQDLVRGIPPQLCDLCTDLLQREPTARPTGEQFLARLRAAVPAGTSDVAPLSVPRDAEPRVTLVGREPHLWALSEALGELELGHSVLALVHGLSGMGKTSLVRHFVEMVRERHPDVLVLEGRCYEREAVPFKAVDSLVDALARYLVRLPEVEAAALLPRDLSSLARLFPVFLQLKATFAKRGKVAAEATEERRRAFLALRELLHRLADRGPVVLFVDDLQWADADSTPLLTTLLRGPDAPALLFVGAYRSEDADTSPLVTALRDLGAGEDAPYVCEVPVAELPVQAVRELATSLLGTTDEGTIETLSREAGGSPLFLRQLAALGAGGGALGLSEVVLRRMKALPDDARRLLEVLAVFGKPMELGLAMLAAGLEHDADAVLRKLQAESLARSRSRNGRSEIEVYHDRIREVVSTSLPADQLTACHGRIARTLAGAGDQDAEALAVHYFAASEHRLAARYAEEAAERATRTLAFDRAARMFQMVIDLESDRSGESRSIVAKLAQALANAGRGKEAAERFLQAAGQADGAQALEFKRQAAEQLLLTGHLAEGLSVVDDILRVMKVSAPKTPWGSLLSLLFRRALLRLRGLNFRTRSIDTIPRDELVRIDTYFSLSRGLGLVDTWRGVDFQTRYLLAALSAGEPARIAMGIASEAAYRAADGVSARSVIEKLVAKASELAIATDNVQARAFSMLTHGIAKALLGDFVEAEPLCDAAADELRERCAGVVWERDNAALFGAYSRLHIGKLNEIRARLPAALTDMRARGDLYGEVSLRVLVAWFICLADDDAEGAHQELDVLDKRWYQERWLIQHGWQAIHGTEVCLYQGNTEKAYATILGAWPGLKRSLSLRTESVRVRAINCRARAALALACTRTGHERTQLVAEARKLTRALGKERWALARGYSLALRAALAHNEKQAVECVELLHAAEQEFEQKGARLYAWSCRARRGQLGGNEAGTALFAAALDQLRTEGIKQPARMLRVFTPGAYDDAGSALPPA